MGWWIGFGWMDGWTELLLDHARFLYVVLALGDDGWMDGWTICHADALFLVIGFSILSGRLLLLDYLQKDDAHVQIGGRWGETLYLPHGARME